MAAKPKIMTNVGLSEPWTMREKLCLASSVMRSGDQNWVSVSRAIKPFAEPGRQPDFFSQRNCARQYSSLLESEETPKRKRSTEKGEVVETPGDLIVKKITMERIDELKAQIREDKLRFKQLKKEIEEIRSGTLDDKLQDMCSEIQSKRSTPEEVGESSRSSIETVKPSKSPIVPSASKSSKKPPSRSISKTSRTSEGSDIDVVKHTDEPAGDSVFDFDESSSDIPTPSILDKRKLDLEKQESNDSLGGTEESDVDVTVVSDVKSSSGSSTLSKLLTQKVKSSFSSSTSPLDGPGSLSSVSKTTAAKEAAKILLRGAGGGDSSEVCAPSRGFQSVFSSFVQSDKETEKKSKTSAENKSESKESSDEATSEVKPSTDTQSKGPQLRAKLQELFVSQNQMATSTSSPQEDPKNVEPVKVKLGDGEPTESDPKPAETLPSTLQEKDLEQEAMEVDTPNRQQRRRLRSQSEDTGSLQSLSQFEDGDKGDQKTDGSTPERQKNKGLSVVVEQSPHCKEKTDKGISNEAKKTGMKEETSKEINEDAKVKGQENSMSPIHKRRGVNVPSVNITKDAASPKLANKKKDEDKEMATPKSAKKDLKKKRGRPAKLASPKQRKTQDLPKLDLDDVSKIDAAEDSDASNIPTEPPSPSRPELDTRGKKKSRGRPPSSARRSGRTRARVQGDGDEGDDDSRRPSIGDDDGRDEARSETAESEETERPSAESDRDDASSIAAGSLQQSLFVDSLPGSPSSVTTEHEHDHTYKIWRKAIMLVWRTIAAHKYANIFLHPVTNDIAPGYCDIIHRRTDLTKIKKGIESGTIRTTEQFHRDIMLMFQNAIMYNNKTHDVYKMAEDMQKDAVVYIEEFISTQLLVHQPDSVKMLRSKDGGSRRSETAPAKEEGEKQRRGSAEAETSGKKRRTRADEC